MEEYHPWPSARPIVLTARTHVWNRRPPLSLSLAHCRRPALAPRPSPCRAAYVPASAWQGPPHYLWALIPFPPGPSASLRLLLRWQVSPNRPCYSRHLLWTTTARALKQFRTEIFPVKGLGHPNLLTPPLPPLSPGSLDGQSHSLWYPPPIPNSAERDAASSRVSSIPITNGLDPNQRPTHLFDEDQSVTRIPLHPYSGAPNALCRDSYDFGEPISYTDSGAPARRPSGDFEPSQPPTTGLPVGPAQTGPFLGRAALVSIFCHACGHGVRGTRDEALEMLDRHQQCMRTIDRDYANPLTLKRSHGTQQQPFYPEGPSKSIVIQAEDRELQSHNVAWSRQSSSQDPYPDHRQYFESQTGTATVHTIKSYDVTHGGTLPDAGHYPHRSPYPDANDRPPILDRPRASPEQAYSPIDQQAITVPHATASSTGYVQPYDEKPASTSQYNTPSGSSAPKAVPPMPPRAYMSGPTQVPTNFDTDTTDWFQSGGGGSVYPPPGPPVHRAYDPIVQFSPYDPSSGSNRA